MQEPKVCAGECETHITIALQNSGQWEHFREWCCERELKCVYIALERGQTPSQPMLTREGRGSLPEELEAATQLSRECVAAGFDVVRIKLEVAPWNRSVPANAMQAKTCGEGRYFEHHIKLLMPADADGSALEAAIRPWGAHLSRNARRVRAGGQAERFVTGRCYDVGRDEAQMSFEALLAVLQKSAFPIIETEREYVIFDSNLALDEGWLP